MKGSLTLDFLFYFTVFILSFNILLTPYCFFVCIFVMYSVGYCRRC